MSLRDKINEANRDAVQRVIQSDPVWVDIQPAGEAVEGLEDFMILHAGPPVSYHDMCPLHRRGMVSGVLLEGWAETPERAGWLLENGRIKIESAMDHNTVGAGTGIITKSVAMMVVEDRTSTLRAATFPAEGAFQGGFCGWGLYSPDIADNLRRMREELFPPLRDCLRRMDGLPIKPILAESFQMGDENHTRQSAADLLFIQRMLLPLLESGMPEATLNGLMHYIVDTPRFFHCFGQAAARVAMKAASDVPYSTMVTAACGNALEYGIKLSGMGDRWFTAPAPMMKGRYTSSRYTEKDQLPWMGDSCVVECAGMGGLAAAASPIVCCLRGLSLADAIALTREMQTICITVNPAFPVPNLDFDCLPVGIDARLVLKTATAPEIHGGMFSHEGGLIGAGSARIPLLCFENALTAFREEYRQ